eukprot:CAMPEP_0181325506 /NCGR_PEP_ID=MMETSP1101-20121128/20969_1 /TAXON_ID=46948 /ORGANISM="Rhodomonas abbreviata, Strain Caron Lab Isolate" /LENGTH=350 /DNA_ID=CAMNT_0023433833 /DNA_START=80 /DNA_END=1132 /DNA_ORIENTATION=+
MPPQEACVQDTKHDSDIEKKKRAEEKRQKFLANQLKNEEQDDVRPPDSHWSKKDESYIESMDGACSQAQWAREMLKKKAFCEFSSFKFDVEAVAEQARWAKERLDSRLHGESDNQHGQVATVDRKRDNECNNDSAHAACKAAQESDLANATSDAEEKDTQEKDAEENETHEDSSEGTGGVVPFAVEAHILTIPPPPTLAGDDGEKLFEREDEPVFDLVDEVPIPEQLNFSGVASDTVSLMSADSSFASFAGSAQVCMNFGSRAPSSIHSSRRSSISAASTVLHGQETVKVAVKAAPFVWLKTVAADGNTQYVLAAHTGWCVQHTAVPNTACTQAYSATPVVQRPDVLFGC